MGLIGDAVANRATDLHINTKENEIIVRQRIDGALSPLAVLPPDLGNSVINVFKVMADLNIADRRRSQDGSFRIDVNERRLSLRVSSQGTQSGEKLSIRLLDPAKSFSELSALGMTAILQERLTSVLRRTNGLILVAGATGAGKSTTACACLQTIDGEDRNILSIEDPIEYQIPSVDQIEVNYRAGQTFESALRSVLRQDADVIFIGEIRDHETAKTACQAAMTGQLVVATVHAGDAVSGAMRLTELGVDLHSVTHSLRAVLAQKLVRRLCVECRESYTPDPESPLHPGMTDFEGVLYRSPDISANQCVKCDGRGFLTRTGVFELLEVTAKIRDLLGEQREEAAVAELAEANGMTTLIDDGLRLVREGVISLEEFNRIFDSE